MPVFKGPRKPTFVYNQEKKLNYISLFEEKTDPSFNMIKIHVKKKDAVPAPTAYARQQKWTYMGAGDDPKKGKWRNTHRTTHTNEIIIREKRAKTPGPATYKPKFV